MISRTKTAASFLFLAGLSLASYQGGNSTVPTPASAAAPVPQSQMTSRCIDEAAKRLNRPSRDLQTPLPIEVSAEGSVVYGQWPAEGDVEGTFECYFDASGVFVKAYQTSK